MQLEKLEYSNCKIPKQQAQIQKAECWQGLRCTELASVLLALTVCRPGEQLLFKTLFYSFLCIWEKLQFWNLLLKPRCS